MHHERRPASGVASPLTKEGLRGGFTKTTIDVTKSRPAVSVPPLLIGAWPITPVAVCTAREQWHSDSPVSNGTSTGRSTQVGLRPTRGHWTTTRRAKPDLRVAACLPRACAARYHSSLAANEDQRSGREGQKCHRDGTPFAHGRDGLSLALNHRRRVFGACPGDLKCRPVVAVDVAVGVKIRPFRSG